MLADFTKQFADKGVGNPLRMGKYIDAVTGATVSCRLMAGGIRYLLQIPCLHCPLKDKTPRESGRKSEIITKEGAVKRLL
jgi:hypothetical protein